MPLSIPLLVECITQSYRQQVLPQVEEPVARSFAAAIGVLLDQLARRLEWEEAGYHEELAQLRHLLGHAPQEAADTSGTTERIATLAGQAEALRGEAARAFADNLDAPELRAYMRDQLAREARIYAMRPGDKVY